MKLDRFDKWSGILSNSAVLIGLVVVVLEINQNTRAIESEVAWARLESSIDLQNQLIENPDFARIYFPIKDMTLEEVELSDQIDVQRVARYIASSLLYFEARYITQTAESERAAIRYGVLDIVQDNFSRQVATRFNTVAREARDPEFRLFLDEILAQFPPPN